MTGDFREAIYSQPQNLWAAREAFGGAAREVDLSPLSTGTIIFSGIGASAHAIAPAVLALRAAGRRAFAVSPAELSEPGARALADAFVLVSQSGASAETVDALAQLEGAPVVAISAHGASPLAEAASAWLPLGPFEDTRVASLSYTATLQALGMLCDVLLGTSSGWELLPDLARDVLERTDAVVATIAERLAPILALDAVGGAASQASARETALLAREGLRIPAVGMEAREYLHGPLEAVSEGFGCVVFGRGREHALATELASFGGRVVLVSDEAAVAPSVDAIELPRAPMLVAPILEILPIQLLVDRLAELRGLEIGRLRREQPDTKVAYR